MQGMHISIILSWINKIYPTQQKISSKELSFYNIRIWEHDEQEIMKDYLYLAADTSSLECDWTPQKPPLLICCVKKSHEISLVNTSWHKHVIFLYTEDSFLTVYGVLQNLFDQYKTWYEHCITMILDNKEISEILEYATSCMKNPLAFFDSTGILVQQTGTFQVDITGTLWEEILLSGCSPMESINPKEYVHLTQKITEKEKMIPYVFQQDPLHHTLTLPIYVDGKLCGSIGAVDINAPFTDEQKAFMQVICRLTEKAIKNQVHDTFLREKENFCVIRLLQGFSVEAPSVEHYLKMKNCQNSDIWYLYLFPLLESDGIQPRRSAFTRQFSRIFPCATFVFFKNYFISICRKKDFDPAQKDAYKKLKNTLKRFSMKVYVSSYFFHFTDLYTAYGQCLLMEKYLENEKNILLCFDDSFQSILYCILEEKNSLKGFCHPSVLSLWESNSAQKRTLVRNLKCYLLYGRNIAETSRQLNLHRNTFLYRLQKIQECLHFSLDSLDDNMLLYLLLSCMICETLP